MTGCGREVGAQNPSAPGTAAGVSARPANAISASAHAAGVERGGAFGIIAKVAVALLAAFILTLDALLLVGLGFRSVGDGIGALSDEQLPALADAMLLLRDTERLIELVRSPDTGAGAGADAPNANRSSAQLDATRTRIQAALRRLSTSHAVPTARIDPIAARFGQLFATLAGAPGAGRLALAKTAVYPEADLLLTDLEDLFKQVFRGIEQDGATMRTQLRSRVALLALIPGLLLVITVTTYLYLNRALLQPIVQLRRAMQQARGGGRPRFPPARDDEVGAIVRASRETLEALARRETELRIASAEAERANRAKGLFLAHMSHELRTPLHAMLGFAELARKSRELPPEVQHHCALIERNGRHLLQLIDDLLDLAAIDAGRLAPAAVPTDIHRLLDDVSDNTMLAARAKGLAYEARVEPTLPQRVLTDERRLRQVLTNLLGNAVRHTERGRVSLRATALPLPQQPARAMRRPAINGSGLDVHTALDTGLPQHLHLRFEIHDTGPGIPAAEQTRLFQPFEQLRPGESGTGLGLAISRELAEILGGHLDIDSDTGQGCRITVDLPVAIAEPAAGAMAGNADTAITGYDGPSRRVLVVDDEASLLLLLQHQLTRVGFQVDCADGADAAVKAALQARPDLVLMDMVMPDYCGYAAAHALRERLGEPAPPMIAFSATLLEDPAEAQALGFEDFLPKPTATDELLASIGRCLGLQWQRGAAAPDPATDTAPNMAGLGTTASLAAIHAPARLEIEVGLELVESAAWAELEDWCTDLASGDPDCEDFVAAVRRLAGAGEAPTLQRWLRSQL